MTVRALQPRQARSVGGGCEPDRTGVGMSLPGVRGLASRVVGFTAKRTLLIVLLLTVSDRTFLTNTAFGQALEVAAIPPVSITDIKQFLNTCPEGDPAASQIRADFEIRRDLVLVSEIPCSEPVSEMLIAEYTDELVLLQGLRVAYYMDFGRSGHLPWTPGSFYDWMKSKIGGFTIDSGGGGFSCCTTIDGRLYPMLAAADEFNRDFDRTWRGISGNIGLYAHEVRHVDGFPHVTGCAVAGLACDQTFDLANLSAYGIQWWLNANWLNGNISVGFSCMSPEEVTLIANWHLTSAAVFARRFIDVTPPALTRPQFPGGECMADLDGPLLQGILDAASFRGGAIAPGQIVSLFGVGLAEETIGATQELLPIRLGGTEIAIVDSTGVEQTASLFFVSPSQVNILVPTEIALGIATVRVLRSGLPDTSLAVDVEAVAPGLFAANASGEGVAAALLLRVSNDGSRSSEPVFRLDAIERRFVPSPISVSQDSGQVFLLLFGTGIRGFTSTPTVIIGGEIVPVLAALPQGEFVGLDQVNVGPLPQVLMGRGEVEILMFVDGKQTNTLVIDVQ